MPSATGRALSLGRTSRIGLLVTDLENHFYPHMIAPVHDTLGELGYELILMTDDHDRGDVASRVRANALDGVILATSVSDSAVPIRLRDKQIPFVYFNRVAGAVEADSVTSDPTRGLGALVRTMVERGHRRVGAILGPPNTSTGVSRGEVLRRELARHGLAVRPEHETHGPFETSTGEDGLRRLWDSPEPPSVVVCGNDVVAIGALNAAARMGLRVPQDVSVTGYDNLPESAWPVIGLTTVAFDLRGMAARAASLMAARLAEPERDFEHVTFPSELVVRGSLGPARG